MAFATQAYALGLGGGLGGSAHVELGSADGIVEGFLSVGPGNQSLRSLWTAGQFSCAPDEGMNGQVEGSPGLSSPCLLYWGCTMAPRLSLLLS